MLMAMLAVLVAAGEPRVLTTLHGTEFARRGIVAELVERPAGVSDDAFAQRLIDASGLSPWNGEQYNFAPTREAMGARSLSNMSRGTRRAAGRSVACGWRGAG